MENFSKIYNMKVKQRRVYSESYKREKVSLIEKGEIGVIGLSRLLGMNNPTIIYRWVKKYGKSPLMEKVVVESESDYIRLKELEKQLQEAQQLIGRQQIKLSFYEEVIVKVNEHYGEDTISNFLKK